MSGGYQSNNTKNYVNSADVDSQNMMIVDDQYVDNSVVLLESANASILKLSCENNVLKQSEGDIFVNNSQNAYQLNFLNNGC